MVKNRSAYFNEYRNKHREKNRQYAKQHHARINSLHRLLMGRLKSNGCAICGYNKCINALDFHHVNPKDKTMLVNTHSIHRSNQKIVDEVNKCILLCSNCHREIHNMELL